MAGNDEVEEPKRICHQCVGEDYLREEIEHKGVTAACSYCGDSDKTYTIDEMADRVEKAFEQHFTRTPDQPSGWQLSLLADRESDYEWEREGERVDYAIMDAADIPERAAQDIQEILSDRHGDYEAAKIGEESEFDSDSYYEEKGPSDRGWHEEWRNFQRSLKTEARFFSKPAAAHLSSIFGGIDRMRARDGRPLVMDAGPQTKLSAVYRARVFQSEDKLLDALCRPDQQLGSPPSSLAAAGRMNARGISVFYGANEAGVAVAEVRPPVGAQVAVARFEIIRPLRLLDLTALSTVVEPGSIFDPGYKARLERATFLRSLSELITQSVMPDDEDFEYLPTQAIADFLATENEPKLDGILYPSVQAAGNSLNVVLFHKAAHVEAIAIPKGTEINASSGHTTDDGWETDYSVTEAVPKEEPRKPEDGYGALPDPLGLDALARGGWLNRDMDSREATLRIDLASVNVHIVRGVHFDTLEYAVSRHRFEKHDSDDF